MINQEHFPSIMSVNATCRHIRWLIQLLDCWRKFSLFLLLLFFFDFNWRNWETPVFTCFNLLVRRQCSKIGRRWSLWWSTRPVASCTTTWATGRCWPRRRPGGSSVRYRRLFIIVTRYRLAVYPSFNRLLLSSPANRRTRYHQSLLHMFSAQDMSPWS